MAVRRRRTTLRDRRLEALRELHRAVAEVPVLRREVEEATVLLQPGEARHRAVLRQMHARHRTTLPTATRWVAADPRPRTRRRAAPDNRRTALYHPKQCPSTTRFRLLRELEGPVANILGKHRER